MPRALRIEYPGAIYHVLNWGNRREAIFPDDLDHKRFLATLAEACAKTDWQVHAHCLMPNHFHLVVETRSANLVAGMKWFLSTFTARSIGGTSCSATSSADVTRRSSWMAAAMVSSAPCAATSI